MERSCAFPHPSLQGQWAVQRAWREALQNCWENSKFKTPPFRNIRSPWQGAAPKKGCSSSPPWFTSRVHSHPLTGSLSSRHEGARVTLGLQHALQVGSVLTDLLISVQTWVHPVFSKKSYILEACLNVSTCGIHKRLSYFKQNVFAFFFRSISFQKCSIFIHVVNWLDCNKNKNIHYFF